MTHPEFSGCESKKKRIALLLYVDISEIISDTGGLFNMNDNTAKGFDSSTLADETQDYCYSFLQPLLYQLDSHLDLRLVRTVANTVTAVIRHRCPSVGLLLSELGAYITSPEHAPAGTKRLSNLLHSTRWEAQTIDDYLLEQAHLRVEKELQERPGERVLCILDGSVLEKPESSKGQGLAPVRSSKARRLARPRPKMGKGYFKGKPGGPIVVPGFRWVGVLLARLASVYERHSLTLGAWHWYTKKCLEVLPESVPQQNDGEAEWETLKRVVAVCGKDKLLHVWDRGMSGAPWLGKALDEKWHFVVRWKKGNKLRPYDAPSIGDPQATYHQRNDEGKAAWRLTKLRAKWHRRVINPRNPKQPVTVSFFARPVYLLYRDDPLWLVTVRIGKESKRRRGSSEPWRLLTNEPVETEEQCWRIVEAYAARWQIEQMLRYGKSELGIASVRVRDWEVRRKLLALASLAYAFLIYLLGDSTSILLNKIINWAHRTGRQAKTAWRHLYLLRIALSTLWQKHTPNFQGAS
jgi:hypothetical protein